MLPALGETSWLAAVVESERSVAGDVLWRNGHMVLDWRRRASMMVNGEGRRKRGEGDFDRCVEEDCQRMVAAENLEDVWSGQDARTQIISYADVRDRLSGRRRHQMDVQ
jgi:hypothetical protein